MARDIPVGNGSLLVAFDKNAQIRDVYFPYVGQENHAGGPFRFGAWCEGAFEWTDAGWEIQRDYLHCSMTTALVFTSKAMGIRIRSNDVVDFNENVFLRKLNIENLADRAREIRLFFNHDFQIAGNNIGDTAVYRPDVDALVHYKNDRYFLINCFANEKFGMHAFACGKKEGSLQGTWKDAEDGVLSGSAIAQGGVDSTAAVHLHIEAGKAQECWYWICAGTDFDEVKKINGLVIKKKPPEILKRTFNYWKLWGSIHAAPDSLPEKVRQLYEKSVVIVPTQVDDGGAIIAANDSDAMRFNRDTYSYLWPRDAAVTAYAMDLASHPQVSRNFFRLCGRLVEHEGYFMHKYTPAGLPASSWHPWLQNGKIQLPIQEDATALVLWALGRHFKKYKDVEFIKPLYRPVIKGAADFMMNYRDPQTRLPLPSWDLWEERLGIHAYTCGAIFGGLSAAADFTEAFGDTDLAAAYRRGANDLREAIGQHLYDAERKRFVRSVYLKGGQLEIDPTVDASVQGLFLFGAVEAADERMKETMRSVYDALWCKTGVGGLARYENDYYYRISRRVPGNPWFVTTLWLAQFYVASAQTPEELARGLAIIEWVAEHALPSGVLAEQVHPFTDEPLSVSPLTWSHAELIISVNKYIRKAQELNG
ncbi:MAG: glycoside hydrolase family 15 protein [Planctomycetaceae bacterium]|nr:glycoside hydrolase family 15 protein [Planctomycetaceae bacterium]